MKYRSTLLYLIAFLLICTASFYILRRTKEPILETPKQTINSFIYHGIYTEYNKEGKIKSQITAQKITHFSPDETTLFTHPYIITYTTKGTWHIRANNAKSDKSGEKIFLYGNVTVHQLPTAHQVESWLKTTELTLYPKKSLAMTKKPVILIHPGITIHGVGFHANLKTGQYRLDSESEAVYKP